MVHGERPNCAVEIRWAVQQWCTMYVFVYILYIYMCVYIICDTMGILINVYTIRTQNSTNI